MADNNIDWETCTAHSACIGERVEADGPCLAHLQHAERNELLKELGEGELKASGVTFTDSLLSQVIDALPKTHRNRSTFQGRVLFSSATFQNSAKFASVIFRHDAIFTDAIFQAGGGFLWANFLGKTDFAGAIFLGDAWFQQTFFRGSASFARATFQRPVSFRDAIFDSDVAFDGADFEFQQIGTVGPLIAHGLSFNRTTFQQPIRIEATTCSVSCQSTQFQRGAQLRLRWAQVVLDDADFAGPSILTGISGPSGPLARSEDSVIKACQREDEARTAQPKLLSLRGARVAHLSLANLDLTDCHFFGAYNLDQLHLEPGVTFGITKRARLMRQTWELRQVIAEERAWRVQRSPSTRWSVPAWPAWLEEKDQPRPVPLAAGQIAAIYRALRKGREDIRDEPGAADFYYGEMEMRRYAREGTAGSVARGRVERAILTLYWLTSGYGLRAWRAIGWLAGILGLSLLGLHQLGFVGHQESWSASTLYAAGALTHLLDPSAGLLNQAGQAIRLTVGVAGPILLGLALLAVRGRVKR
jgi:hypothetical protein